MDQYKKRPGTSGISGQLYETKLISLILFRLLHNKNVEDFLLASNMDEIGAFDDVCLKVKLKSHDRHLIVLVQAKHKEKDAATLDDRNELAKWCESIIKIREKFSCNKNIDKYFSGQFNDIDCLFIVYTNAKYDFGKTVSSRVFESSYATNLNDLISTGSVGLQPNYTDRDVEDYNLIILNEEIPILAERFEKYLHDNHSINVMNNEYIIRYHVILKEEVVNVTEIQEKRGLKCRMLSFQDDFFENNEKYIVLFRKHLYKHVLKNRDKIKSKKTLDALISSFLDKPCAATLSPLIENHITYKNEKLEFLMKRPQCEIERLEQINISVDTIYDTKTVTAKNILSSLELPVPIAFGNIDLAIRGTPAKIEQRLIHLTNVVVELLRNTIQTEYYKIVTIDDNIEEGLLSSNGGIGGGVGNILEYDSNTKLLKFTSDYGSLHNNAKFLYLKLKERFNNLNEYRFDVKTMKFPRLSLDYSNVARDFLSKLLIYEKQSNHAEVEEKLKNEIKDYHLITNPQCASDDSEAIFIHYHHVIQNWWLSTTTEFYLCKENNKFQLAIDNIIKEPQMSALQRTFYIHRIKNIDYTFTDDSLQSLNSMNILFRTVIITDITFLMTIKVIQFLRNKKVSNFSIIDLEYVMTLITTHFCKLIEELSKTEKLVIVVFDHSKQDGDRLQELGKAIEKLKVILVTQNVLIEIVKKYFVNTEIIYDEKQSLSDLTPNSRNDIIKNAEVVFQDQKIDCNLLVDDVSVEFITGTVLNKMISGKTLNIGGSLSSFNYEEIKYVYINRKVSQTTVLDDNIDPLFFKAHEDYFSIYSDEKYDDLVRNLPVETLHDIKDTAVLVTAPPGMGKSTLLTHLSLKTKELDKSLWIVRVNLLDHSKQFYNWQVDETDMDSIETMTFICQIILKNYDLEINLKEKDNKMYLDSCTGDEWSTFVLKLFLHSYNNNKLIFLFDGFDEICPNYKDCVIKFFDIVKNYPQKNRMWVTSRPYCDILPDLKRIIGKSFRIEYITDTEQEIYLKKIWQAKLKLDQLSNNQRYNVLSFIDFMSDNKFRNATSDSLQLKFREIYYLCYDYILSNMPLVDIDSPLYFDQYNSYKTSGVVNEDRLDSEKENSKQFGNASPPSKVRLQDETLLRSPLLIYLIADYFVNLICNKTKSYKWDPYINVHKIYRMFIETKLKKILFEEKNKMDVYNPDIMDRYEKDLVDCITLHKKLAACLLLGSPVFKVTFDLEEFEKIDPLMQRGLTEFDDIIDTIKAGKERTGLISHLTPDNLPVYIHMTFTEYFASEFLCDVFETKIFEISDKILLYCTLLCSYSCEAILTWIYGKRKLNKKLDDIITYIETQLPFLSDWYRELFYFDGWSRKQYMRLMASSEKDFENINSFKYNEDYVEKLKEMEPNERDMHIQKIRETIIPNMKPHLKKHFIKPDDAACSSTSSDI